MKCKSIFLIIMALLVSLSFLQNSANAQKIDKKTRKKLYLKLLEQKKQFEIERNKVQTQEEMSAEIKRSKICTSLYQVMLKEKAEETIKRIGCSNGSYFSVIEIQQNKELLGIIVIREQTLESAKSFLRDAQGAQGINYPSKDFGDDGKKYYYGKPVGRDISEVVPVNILFVKGKFVIGMRCESCKSEETYKHFAQFILTAIKEQ